jgi:hypothetical protein
MVYRIGSGGKDFQSELEKTAKDEFSNTATFVSFDKEGFEEFVKQLNGRLEGSPEHERFGFILGYSK